MNKEERNTYTIQEEEIGQVQIADEVVAIIAGLAAMEVDGVSSMAGTATRELISKLGRKNLSKGVKVDVLEGVVTVSLSLNLRFGKNVLEVASKVQEKVKAAIENMTGLTVADVNVKISGVDESEEE
nr:Asp23/Gls24 family envelope stress response protein [uncultured Sellimonas sp.]